MGSSLSTERFRTDGTTFLHIDAGYSFTSFNPYTLFAAKRIPAVPKRWRPLPLSPPHCSKTLARSRASLFQDLQSQPRLTDSREVAFRGAGSRWLDG